MDVRSLTHICSNGTCYCDWRLTIYGCVDSTGLKIIYLTMIAFSALVSVFSFSIFLHRFISKGHRLFDFNSVSLLKPKPIDCLMLFLTIFNLLRMLTGIILVADVSRTNLLARSFMFEFPWQWGYGACALYLLGIAQTLADSHKSTARQWLPSTKTVDIIGLTFLCLPFVVNNVCSIASGILGSNPQHIELAEVFIRLLYVFWFLHCGSLATAVMYAGVRLVRLLQSHLKKFKSSVNQEQKIQAGLFKIRGLVGVLFLALAGFAVFLLLYGLLRDQIIENSKGSYALCTIWNFLGPVASFFACLAVISNPRIDDKPTLGLPQSSGSSNPGGGTTTGSLSGTDLQGALSADALGRLQKIKADRTDYPPDPHHHFYQEEDEDEEAVGIPLQHSQTNLIAIPLKTAQF